MASFLLRSDRGFAFGNNGTHIMFWQSVGAGITSLLDWHILVGMAAVSAVSILYPIVTILTIGDGESGARSRAGWFVMIVGGPLIQAIAVSGFILLFLPALIAGGGFTPGTLIGPLFWPVFKAGFPTTLLVLVLCFIPIVGRMISNTPGVPVFLQGIFMLKPISKKLYYVISDGKRLADSAFPSFWNSLGYIVIGLAICWLAFIGVAMIADQMKKRRDPIGHMLDQYQSEPSSTMMLLGMFTGPALGIVPLLMYGKFIGISIKSLQ